MDKEKIIEILDEWNFWSHASDCGILREWYLQQFEDMVATKQVVVITGVRRSGKSTLMKQYIKRMIDRGEDRRNFLYLNFEEPKFIDELSVEFLIDAFDAYLEIVQPTGTPNIFLDEVQHIESWERFVRALHEKRGANIFVSGSSAKLLSKELGTALTGRHIDIHVFPLSFREFLEFNNLKLETKLDIVTNKLKIRQMMRKYLSSGGFPLVVLLDGKSEILREYFNDVIIRDIAERHKVTKINKLRSLA
ncbi:MAG TPA: ATP-binding protein, partial [Methanosarcinaceae archaeon]|nr:ATP-binding protein [Methanosarcinaceae archaeon]